jgi:hypothetical protein
MRSSVITQCRNTSSRSSSVRAARRSASWGGASPNSVGVLEQVDGPLRADNNCLVEILPLSNPRHLLTADVRCQSLHVGAFRFNLQYWNERFQRTPGDWCRGLGLQVLEVLQVHLRPRVIRRGIVVRRWRRMTGNHRLAVWIHGRQFQRRRVTRRRSRQRTHREQRRSHYHGDSTTRASPTIRQLRRVITRMTWHTK